MKLISLNVWGGRLMEPLLQFLAGSDADVYCLQEVYHEAEGKDLIWTDNTSFSLLHKIQNILPGYTHLYHPHLGDWWGLSMHIQTGITVQESGERYVYKEKGYDAKQEAIGHTAKNIQYAFVEYNGKRIAIINFHGLWNGKGKGDTEDRIQQSKNIIEFLSTLTHEIVLCGDFNLLPDTESIALFEAFGLRNLIKEYGITSTRTSFYTKENTFADYVFVTSGITVKEFKVLPDEVSDHSPLYLEFE